MKTEQIKQLFEQLENACYEYKGVECWSARELQSIFNYSEWHNFLKIINKAREACENSGTDIPNHFVEANKMVELGSGSKREIEDIALTRYACYLIAQNGDAAKPAIAFAQTYFAVQTRKQEIIEERLLNIARVAAREKLSKSEKKLSGIIYERGADDRGFAIIRSKGDRALFGGFSTNEMKRKLQVPANRPLADFLPTLTIKAKDFATELTSHNIIEKDLKGEDFISKEHADNNRGVKPELLLSAGNVKRVRKKLRKEEKSIQKTFRGIKGK